MMQPLTLIVVLPLVGFVLNGALGNRLGNKFVTIVGCGLPIAAFLIAIRCLADLLAGGSVPLTETAYTWARIGEHTFNVAF